MSLDGLRHTFDRIVEGHAPAATPQKTLVFDLDLFTDEERAQFAPLHKKVTTRPEREALADLSDEELDQLGGWINLHNALAADDNNAADLARRRLAMTTQNVIQAFLALDINRLPENACTKDEHGFYSFQPVIYRDIVSNHINRNRITLSTLDDMRKWIHFYDQLLPAQQ